MLSKKTIDHIDVNGKNVLVRCDFNVPIQDGKITSDARIVGALPTIKKLVEGGGRVILCSHLGQPKEVSREFSLAPVASRLSKLLTMPVAFAADDEVVSDAVRKAVSTMKNGDILLLENTRFRKEETKNGEAFSKDLASLADIYVNDAFGSSHRAHCSTVGVAQFVKESAVGYLMQQEIRYLDNAVNNPARPFVAILGGSKVSDKINVINTLLEKIDTLIIGGGMAYTFIKAMGHQVGNSLLELDKTDYAQQMIAKAKAKGVRLLLPVDTVVADKFCNSANFKTVDISHIDDGWMGLDIGEKTRQVFADAISTAKTVIWNGPMGVFEMENFNKGTVAVAKAMTKVDGMTVIGGGDSAAAVVLLGFGDKMTHISTGGGASLEFLEGRQLPGIVAVQDNNLSS